MIKEILMGVIVSVLVLPIGFYVFQTMDKTLIENPDVTQIGAPLEFNWVAFVVVLILAFIVGIMIVVTDGGINPGARQP